MLSNKLKQAMPFIVACLCSAAITGVLCAMSVMLEIQHTAISKLSNVLRHGLTLLLLVPVVAHLCNKVK